MPRISTTWILFSDRLFPFGTLALPIRDIMIRSVESERDIEYEDAAGLHGNAGDVVGSESPLANCVWSGHQTRWPYLGFEKTLAHSELVTGMETRILERVLPRVRMETLGAS